MVSKYPVSNLKTNKQTKAKTKEESLQKWLISVLEPSKCSMSLEHSAVSENKEVLKE